jgi:hypothetical protein
MGNNQVRAIDLSVTSDIFFFGVGTFTVLSTSYFETIQLIVVDCGYPTVL